MKIEKKVLDMSLAGIFTAIIIAMSVVPFLGYIPLGFMNATIIHVPVIIGAIILGPKYGAYLGLVFGVTSLVKATICPGSDLLRIQPVRYDRRIQRKLWSAVIAIVPRVCIGIVAIFVIADHESSSRNQRQPDRCPLGGWYRRSYDKHTACHERNLYLLRTELRGCVQQGSGAHLRCDPGNHPGIWYPGGDRRRYPYDGHHEGSV